jgi:hypothetical protein
LRQENASTHNALSVKQFLVSNNTAVLAHPPYLPDLAPCDFFLFPKIKSMLKEANFVSTDEVKAKTMKLLNCFRENNLQHCFEQWQHCMQLCLNSEGDYPEGDHN